MTVEQFQYRALCVDPEMDTRMRLRQATIAVPFFNSVRQCTNMQEALSLISSDEAACDIIFIAERLAENDASTLITKAKECKQSEDAAFVLVMSNAEDAGNKISQLMLRGFDGFLVEPYSVDALTEITRLAAKVKKERGEARAKTAAQIVVKEMMDQLDLVAFLRSCGYGLGRSWNRFKELGAQLTSLGGHYWDVCVGTVVNLIADAPLSNKLMQERKYGGVSQRVRKKMEEKLLAEAQRLKDSPEQEQPKIIRKNSP